jgi:hypothetical protein
MPKSFIAQVVGGLKEWIHTFVKKINFLSLQAVGKLCRALLLLEVTTRMAYLQDFNPRLLARYLS